MVFKGFVIRVSFLWVAGMAVFPFVFIKNKNPGVILLHHECIHLRQQLEMGFILFYAWYLIEYLVRLICHRNHDRAYRAISFEREAYQYESSLTYLQKRPFWAFLRYM
jgi:hypothetical protein